MYDDSGGDKSGASRVHRGAETTRLESLREVRRDIASIRQLIAAQRADANAANAIAADSDVTVAVHGNARPVF